MCDHCTHHADGNQDNVPLADESSAPGASVSREAELNDQLSCFGIALARAGYALYEAQSRGVTTKEAADHFGVSEKFLGVLAEYAHTQLANEVWHAIECHKDEIRQHETKLAELKRERALLGACDEGTILSLIGRSR